MARHPALRIGAAAVLAVASTTALSAWIGDTAAEPQQLADHLGAGPVVFAERGTHKDARVVEGEHAYAAAVAAVERAGAVCDTRTGYVNAGRGALAAEVSRYSTTRCDLDGLGIAIYQWWEGQRPQYGFDRPVPALTADGASIVVAPASAGFGRQGIFGDTVERIQEWGEAALTSQGIAGYELDCGTHRVGVDETSVDCIATGADDVSVPARVDFASGPLYARVELGESPVRLL